MLAPNMATMLAVLTTDAAVDGEVLQRVLQAGVDKSFNLMMTDGCTSTNDTVILLASGLAGPAPESDLADAVAEACFSLASQMTGDAEGATKVVRVVVTGATSDDEALTGARAIARSALCKCSWFGEDPYWGRIGSELGAAGIEFEADSLSVSYGGTTVAAGGVTVDHDAAAVKAHMANRHIEVAADLGRGDGRAFVLTNDLTPGYIDENMRTS
jgi:glutamate N-acetyltransferase/amino-acid N-acetyltransferase